MSTYGSFELTFSYPPSPSLELQVITNILGLKAWGLEEDGASEISISITTTEDGSDEYITVATLINDEVIDQSDFLVDDSLDTTSYDVRLIFYNSAVFLYVNEKWVYFYAFSAIDYPTVDVVASLKAIGAGVTITDICQSELPDGREAVWVDYEATSDSVVQSIIQQRPLEIFAEVDRRIGFTYDAIKDDVSPNKVILITEEENDDMSACVDGLVYGMDVSISQCADAAEEIGFVTRLFRLSELDTGVQRAAQILQEKALERRTPIGVEMRFDPRVEHRDVLTVTKTISGTQRVYSKRAIVVSQRFTIEGGEGNATVSCREDK